jgi:uncharacterized membrane protein HdeD (DUF308 family)
MSTTQPEPAVEVTRFDVRRSWPFVLAVGIVSLVAGVLTLVWPGATVLALVIVLGVFLLIAGVTEIGWAIAERHTEGWGLILFRGIVDLIAGIVVLAWPAATALVLALLLAAWLLVYAAMTLWYAYRHRGERPHTGHFVARRDHDRVAGDHDPRHRDGGRYRARDQGRGPDPLRLHPAPAAGGVTPRARPNDDRER